MGPSLANKRKHKKVIKKTQREPMIGLGRYVVVYDLKTGSLMIRQIAVYLVLLLNFGNYRLGNINNQLVPNSRTFPRKKSQGGEA